MVTLARLVPHFYIFRWWPPQLRLFRTSKYISRQASVPEGQPACLKRKKKEEAFTPSLCCSSLFTGLCCNCIRFPTFRTALPSHLPILCCLGKWYIRDSLCKTLLLIVLPGNTRYILLPVVGLKRPTTPCS